MLKTLELLKHKLFTGYEIPDFKQGKDVYYLKIKAVLLDKSELYIREYVKRNRLSLLLSLARFEWYSENQVG
jgi:hypothetical protein